MKFDVFLSHNRIDKPAVENLAYKLETKNFKVHPYKWILIPSEPWQEGFEEVSLILRATRPACRIP
jgi:hypothetical protein